VNALPDLATLDDEALTRLIHDLEREEDEISKRRRLLHGRIDILRAERVTRLTARVAEGEVDIPSPGALERPLFQGTGDLPEEGELEAMPDLGSLSDDELRAMILALEHEEDDVSLKRRFLHGHIDILRAERYRRRRGENVDPEGLAAVLAQRLAQERDPANGS
jgi:hypothetical protein